VSPVGNDVPTIWRNLIAGRSGIGPITRFDPTGFDTRIAGEVRDFRVTDYLEAKEARRMDRFAHYALAAAKQAQADAQLAVTAENADAIGAVLGSGIGGIETLIDQTNVLQTRGPGRVSPFSSTMMIINIAPGQVAIHLGLKGPNWGIVSACATSAHAIGEAYEVIRRGDAEAMFAGGSEATITPLGIAAFNAARAISTYNEEPQKASRPFDARRDGFVLAEGGAVILLESLEFALARGAPRIYGEIVGYGATADAYHVTAPPEGAEGAVRAMRRALAKAGLRPEEVEYLNAHGTSTPLNDKTETQAIKTVFGEYAYRLPISSTKSMTGHMLGAAGAIESIACLLAMTEGIIPPTINLEVPDPACDLDYVPNVARRLKPRVAMNNSFGFGGQNACLIFRAFE
jgi:3-oxoacyl-[acyl-carrier-protein] synthase II